MKYTFLKLVMIIGISLTYSCGHQTKEKHDHKQIEKVEKDSHSKSSDLVLNNGKVWIANTETTTGIENMINMMHSFTEKNNVKAYEKLEKNLKSEFIMVFKKCTMTGEAHNQLHNFLIPIKDLFEKLLSSDIKECQESFIKLNKHLKEYEKYFK